MVFSAFCLLAAGVFLGTTLLYASKASGMKGDVDDLVKERDALLAKSEGLTDEVRETEKKLIQSEARLESELRGFEEKLKIIQKAEVELKESFKALSSEALEKNNKQFMDLANANFEKLHEKSKVELEKKEQAVEKMIKPMGEALDKLDKGMNHLEKERREDSVVMKEQIKAMIESEKELVSQTTNLVNSLNKSDVRGMWGEVQLKRVVELSGMLSYCDFSLQESKDTEGGKLRPDMIVHLPGERNVIVDSKVPLSAFLEANQTKDPERQADRLKAHARHLKTHIQQLGKKAYQNHFDNTPEFVVLFLPAEVFFSAALEVDPSIIEMGAANNVVIATPTTLIGLLRAIAFGWKQDILSQSARQISELGHDLYKRLYDMSKHWAGLGKHLSSSVESFNKAMGSYEKRVLVTARKFKEHGCGQDEIELQTIDSVEKVVKDVKSDPLLLEEN
ncbi:MAG: hypothetical protein S4CHLAM102_02990 [Chlamydiia bacterium]|nr:hypothetical protein [Chlamydiia bacterium]